MFRSRLAPFFFVLLFASAVVMGTTEGPQKFRLAFHYQYYSYDKGIDFHHLEKSWSTTESGGREKIRYLKDNFECVDQLTDNFVANIVESETLKKGLAQIDKNNDVEEFYLGMQIISTEQKPTYDPVERHYHPEMKFIWYTNVTLNRSGSKKISQTGSISEIYAYCHSPSGDFTTRKRGQPKARPNDDAVASQVVESFRDSYQKATQEAGKRNTPKKDVLDYLERQ